MPGSPLGGSSRPGPLGLSILGAPAPIVLAGFFGPSDELAAFPPDQVAAWYGRLADLCEKRGGVLAPATLRFWLANRDPTAKHVIAPHPHLQNSMVVADGLAFHRKVYLTEEKARLAGGKEKWAGIIPRLQGSGGFTKWDGKGSLDMNYTALAAYSIAQTARFGFNSMPPEEADVFTSFHNFQLRTDVNVTIAVAQNKTTLTFQSFTAKALDRYDWDASKHLTMPNPDYQSKSPKAIRPDLNQITVYHSNAKRIEAAGFAAPYDLETNPWTVTDQKYTSSAVIDPNKKLS
jgi:hypothetical protein